MILTDLASGIGVALDNLKHTEISGIALNSESCKQGYLFAALQGSKIHGIEFLQSAKKNGAVAVLSDPAQREKILSLGLIPLISGNPQRDLSLLAARFYAPIPKTIAAVTGTNGKTSSTVFARQIWGMLGNKSASIGTIGIIGDGINLSAALTTPDAVFLHQTLQSLAQKGVTHAALEASSHGLLQHRLDGLAADIAAFTNLTRDHLDYHGTMEEYFAAKLILFERIVKPQGFAVINRDIAEFHKIESICKSRNVKPISFGKQGSDIHILAVKPEHDGQAVEFFIFGEKYTAKIPLLGSFQVYNIACAIGIAVASGAKPKNIMPHIAHLQGVPGRMQPAGVTPSGAPVFVDYAHTPDAIENVLRSLRPHTKGRLAILFGCGGDRDPGKRPIMGGIAQQLADKVYVTDDNPRTEDPAKIRAAILQNCPKALEIGDRAEAIRQAIAALEKGDALIIAGKGHEPGQIVGKQVLPFDDAEEARKALNQLKEAAA